MKPFLSCRQASALVLLRCDRPLGWLERLRLRLHLGMCEACTRFARQQRLISRAMGPWRAYRQDDPADEP